MATATNTEKTEELVADTIGIIKVVDQLERFYIRNIISAEDYTAQCSALIGQFRAAIIGLGLSLNAFVERHKVLLSQNDLAIKRLQTGIPATTEMEMAPRYVTCDGAKTTINAKVAAETTQNFITAMDNLRLELLTTEVLLPLLVDLDGSLRRIPALLPDCKARTNVSKWVSCLNGKKVTDRLSEEECKQMTMDLEVAYSDFHNNLAFQQEQK